LVTCSVLHAASTMPEPRDATRKPRLGQMMRGAQHRIRCCWRLRYNRLTRSSRRDYLLFFPGNTGDSDIFALAASSFWFLSAMSCFLDLSFAFGDLSPMVIASCSLSSGMLPPFQGKSKTIARWGRCPTRRLPPVEPGQKVGVNQYFSECAWGRSAPESSGVRSLPAGWFRYVIGAKPEFMPANLVLRSAVYEGLAAFYRSVMTRSESPEFDVCLHLAMVFGRPWVRSRRVPGGCVTGTSTGSVPFFEVTCKK